MAQNDKIQLVAKGSLYGVTCVTTLPYVETVDGGANALQNLLAAFRDNVVPDWMAVLSEDFTLLCLEATLVDEGPASPRTLQLTSNNVGLVESPSLPANRVMTVSEYSETYNRNGRGRHYFSGIPVSREEDNCISQESRADLEAFAATLKGNVVSGTLGEWQRVIRSLVAEDDYPVEVAVFSPQVRTLRSRTPRLCG